EAVLIGRKGSENEDLIQELIQRIQSVLRAKETKYVVLNVLKDNLDDVIALLPGVKSPSVVPLAEADWVAVHTVIPERDFWDRISQLKQAGAQGIVVCLSKRSYCRTPSPLKVEQNFIDIVSLSLSK